MLHTRNALSIRQYRLKGKRCRMIFHLNTNQKEAEVAI